MLFDYAKRCEKNMLISTCLIILLGIVLLFEPSGSIKVITGLIAAILTLIGLLQIIDYIRQSKQEKMMSLSLILGIILCSLGIFLFIRLEALVNFITTLIGLTIVIKSLFKLQYAFNIKSLSSKWYYNLIVGLVGMGFGILLLINPFKSAELFLRIIGGFFFVGGIIELIETFLVMGSLDVAKVNAMEIPFEEKNKESKEI